MKLLKLPILHHTDNTTQMRDIGVDYDLADCQVKEISFLNIDAISEYIDGDDKYSCIHVNDNEYICTFTYSKLIKLIEGWIS
jgi:hypothetical protein